MAFTVLAVGNGNAATNGEKCAAAKMKVAGKYTACRLSIDSKAESEGESPDYTKCDSAQAAGWQKIEDKYGVECLTSGDQASVQNDLTNASNCVSGVLAGNGGSCTVSANPPCAPGGVIAYGTCWLLGAAGDSCNAACGLAGMQFDNATLTNIGDANNLARCLNVLDLLGFQKGGSFQVQGPPNVGCPVSGTTPFHSGTVTAQGQFEDQAANFSPTFRDATTWRGRCPRPTPRRPSTC